ncbi:alpha/beta fold hydrolase [Actinomadura rupiterrae]|uniref:alpha/beta fold hydrolase n=1 Tax=Actinomadura rupiterrae TaxID=559627 RepID=UPI0020A252E3|nr:alpha/beta hydrolase [Actinomadura rupiterrae]MCP2338341.1 pimeloyl-ACP methyl ester carboxylesterase [Actinomadura rupiterrae]
MTDQLPNEPATQAPDQTAANRPGPDADAVARVPASARLRRWTRRTLLVLVTLWGLVTAASMIVVVTTSKRAAVPAGLSFVQAGDVRTRYREWGSGGSPVVLVHGAFESADAWTPTADVLGRTHHVYALDLTGYGYSEHKSPYNAAHMADQVNAFIAAMHLAKPVIVGHSSGAAVVAEAALRRPSAIGGLMLLDGDALLTGAGQKSPVSYLLIDPYRTAFLRVALRSDWLVRTAYARACGPRCPRLDKQGVDQWRRPFMVPGAEKAAWQMLRNGVVGIPTKRLEQVRTLPMPKSVVFGADDFVFSKSTPAETAARIGAPSPTLIPRAAHMTFISDPVPVATAISALASR